MPIPVLSPTFPVFFRLYHFRLLFVWVGLALCAIPFACRKKDNAAVEKNAKTPEAKEKDTLLITEYAFSLKGPNDTEGSFSFPRVSGPFPPTVLARLNEHFSVPQLTDMTEAEIRKTVEECGCGLVNTDFTVLYNQNGILCIEATREWLGAYSSFSAERLVLSTATGEPLSIGQLLQPAALPDLVRQCNNLLQERMEEARREAPQDGETGQLLAELLAGKTFTTAHLEEFTVSKDGIRFYYPFGFPHVATALEPDNAFDFSFAQLKPYLKPDGPLARQPSSQAKIQMK